MCTVMPCCSCLFSLSWSKSAWPLHVGQSTWIGPQPALQRWKGPLSMTSTRPSNPRELGQSPESPVALQHLCTVSFWFVGPKMAPCRSNPGAGRKSWVVVCGKPLGAEHARWRRGHSPARGAAPVRGAWELCWRPVGLACSLRWEAEGSRQRSRKGAVGNLQVGRSPPVGLSPYESGEARRPRCLLTGSSGPENSGSS